jgi:hypothetical protein
MPWLLVAAAVAVVSAAAGCGGPGPSAKPTSTAAASAAPSSSNAPAVTVSPSIGPTSTPSALPSGYAEIVASVTVNGPPPPGGWLQLDLAGTPASSTLSTFCGAPQAGCAQGKTYSGSDSFPPGSYTPGKTVTYKFERVTSTGGLQIFKEGSFPLRGVQRISAVYSG